MVRDYHPPACLLPAGACHPQPTSPGLPLHLCSDPRRVSTEAAARLLRAEAAAGQQAQRIEELARQVGGVHHSNSVHEEQHLLPDSRACGGTSFYLPSSACCLTVGPAYGCEPTLHRPATSRPICPPLICALQLDKLSVRSRVGGRDLKLPIQQARLLSRAPLLRCSLPHCSLRRCDCVHMPAMGALPSLLQA